MARKKIDKIDKESIPRFFYLVLFCIAILFLSVILITVNHRNGAVTAWATARSEDLHSFMSDCHQKNGVVDVEPGDMPKIVFVCTYPDGELERYFLNQQ